MTLFLKLNAETIETFYSSSVFNPQIYHKYCSPRFDIYFGGLSKSKSRTSSDMWTRGVAKLFSDYLDCLVTIWQVISELSPKNQDNQKECFPLVWTIFVDWKQENVSVAFASSVTRKQTKTLSLKAMIDSINFSLPKLIFWNSFFFQWKR